VNETTRKTIAERIQHARDSKQSVLWVTKFSAVVGAYKIEVETKVWPPSRRKPLAHVRTKLDAVEILTGEKIDPIPYTAMAVPEEAALHEDNGSFAQNLLLVGPASRGPS
jgi:hypothetical protein